MHAFNFKTQFLIEIFGVDIVRVNRKFKTAYAAGLGVFDEAFQ